MRLTPISIKNVTLSGTYFKFIIEGKYIKLAGLTTESKVVFYFLVKELHAFILSRAAALGMRFTLVNFTAFSERSLAFMRNKMQNVFCLHSFLITTHDNLMSFRTKKGLQKCIIKKVLDLSTALKIILCAQPMGCGKTILHNYVNDHIFKKYYLLIAPNF